MDRTIALTSTSRHLPARTTLNGIYEIDEFIADGGMGEVYRGHNIQTGDAVAIKTILPDLANNPDARTLFRNEATTLNKLNHEGIVRYFTFAVDPQLQRAYLAMEYVGGPSLASRLDQGPLQLDTVKHLARRLASALATAHSYGVVHRDISPDNIILAGGDVRQAKLIDFGIAKSSAVGERTIIGNSFAGKHSYASPEQMGLAGGKVGPKSDVYSLGLVLAEALTGRPIGKAITNDEAVAIRRRVPDLSSVDPSFRPLLESMLQPDPDKRPAMADVAAWQGGRPEKSRFEDVAVEGTGRRRRRGRGFLYHLFGTLLPIVIGGGGALLFYAGIFDDSLPGQTLTTDRGTTTTGQTQTGADCPPGTATAGPPVAGSVEYYIAAINASLIAAGLAPLPLDCAVAIADSGGGQPEETSTVGQTQTQTQTDVPVTTGQDTGGQTPVRQDNGTTGQQVPVTPANRPPNAPVSSTTLAGATVGTRYTAFLPPFGDEDPATLALGTEGTLPPGLSLVGRGSGTATLEGTPTAAGTFSFAVVATDAAGLTARVQATIVVAPGAATPVGGSTTGNTGQTASTGTGTTTFASAAEMVAAFDGGACFHAILQGTRLVGYGTSRAPLDRLAGNIAAAFGTAPATQFNTVTAAQCAAVDVAAVASGPAPTVTLDSGSVQSGGSLSATITGLNGRLFRVLVVSGSGSALDVTGTPFLALSNQTADSTRFTFGPVSFTSGSDQGIVLVVAADRIPVSLIAPGDVFMILPQLRNEIAGGADAGVGIATFSVGGG